MLIGHITNRMGVGGGERIMCNLAEAQAANGHTVYVFSPEPISSTGTFPLSDKIHHVILDFIGDGIQRRLREELAVMKQERRRRVLPAMVWRPQLWRYAQRRRSLLRGVRQWHRDRVALLRAAPKLRDALGAVFERVEREQKQPFAAIFSHYNPVVWLGMSEPRFVYVMHENWQQYTHRPNAGLPRTVRSVISVNSFSPAKIRAMLGRDNVARTGVARTGVMHASVRHIRNALPPPDSALLVEEFAHPRPFILCVGSLYHIKGQGLVIRAFAQSQFAGRGDLILLGDGGDAATYHALVDELRLGDRLVFLPSRLNPYPLMRAATAHVSACLNRGFELTSIESLQVGCPVVIANNDDHSEQFIGAHDPLAVVDDRAVVSRQECGLAHDFDAIGELARVIDRVTTVPWTPQPALMMQFDFDAHVEAYTACAQEHLVARGLPLAAGQ